MEINSRALSKYFDHTILKPDASIDLIRQVADEGLAYNCASVCINSCHTALVAKILQGSDVKVQSSIDPMQST
jgi:deoxyribose-phosphate aldolase